VRVRAQVRAALVAVHLRHGAEVRLRAAAISFAGESHDARTRAASAIRARIRVRAVNGDVTEHRAGGLPGTRAVFSSRTSHLLPSPLTATTPTFLPSLTGTVTADDGRDVSRQRGPHTYSARTDQCVHSRHSKYRCLRCYCCCCCRYRAKLGLASWDGDAAEKLLPQLQALLAKSSAGEGAAHTSPPHPHHLPPPHPLTPSMSLPADYTIFWRELACIPLAEAQMAVEVGVAAAAALGGSDSAAMASDSDAALNATDPMLSRREHSAPPHLTSAPPHLTSPSHRHPIFTP